jgi:phosphoribosylformylglycinamidine synthase
MAMAGGIGATLDLPGDAAALFGEDQGRYIVVTSNPVEVEKRAQAASVPVACVGVTGGDSLTLDGDTVAVAALSQAHEGWLPAYMAGPV